MTDDFTSSRFDDAPSDDQLEMDLVISRLLDGEASEHDLATLREKAAASPELWSAFAAQSHDHSLLTRASASLLQGVDHVDLPPSGAGTGTQSPLAFGRDRVARGWRGVAVASGWAAALLFGVAWLISPPTSGNPDAPMVQEVLNEAAIEPFILASEPNETLPPVLLRSRPLPDGRIELLIMRRTTERVFMERFDPDWIIPQPLRTEPSRNGDS